MSIHGSHDDPHGSWHMFLCFVRTGPSTERYASISRPGKQNPLRQIIMSAWIPLALSAWRAVTGKRIPASLS